MYDTVAVLLIEYENSRHVLYTHSQQKVPCGVIGGYTMRTYHGSCNLYIGWARKTWNTLFLTVTLLIFILMSLYFAPGIICLFGVCGTKFR